MERLGFVGLGAMGGAMAEHLVGAGASLSVWNRTPGPAGRLVALGALEAETPADLARRSDVVVTCVSDTPDVEAVLFGTGGLAEGLAPGSLVIDCSTISPSATRDFGRRLAEGGVTMVDAPVSGGPEGARQASLTLFVGGADTDVERARPILERLGQRVTHLGPLGSGQAAKAVNQVVIAGAYLGVAEGILLGIGAGLDPRRLAEALLGGAAQSWVLANRSDRMIDDSYPPGFRLALHRKDMRIALEMAVAEGLTLPVSALTAGLEDSLLAAGHGDEDMSVLARGLRDLQRSKDATSG